MLDLLLDIEGLNIFFGKECVLSNFELRINKGEIVSVVGESGSGKSVSALMSMGLLSESASVSSTSAFVLGNSIDELTPAQWRKIRGKEIAMIFQDPMTALHPTMRIGKQMEEVLEVHTDMNSVQRKARIEEALDEVEIKDALWSTKKYPHELSGGQRQRVVIAMAMLLEPKLIIADEPTTALDKQVEGVVLKLLSDLVRKKSCALWFISHDLELVANFSDRVVVLYQGKTVETGKAKRVFDNPQHPYTKGLLACRPPKKGRPFPLPVLNDFLRNGKAPKTFDLAQTTNGETALEIRGLSIGYNEKRGLQTRKKWVVENVDITLQIGETLGLIGPSGSGKSSIGRSVVDLVPSEYSIRNYNGNKNHIQFIFQDPSSALNRCHSVGQILDNVLLLHGPKLSLKERKKRASELLQEVGLRESDVSKKPLDFSGGQRQRIGIARALAANPKVLICDESVSALDVSVQAQVLNLLNKIKIDRGLSMIFISHDPNVIRYMCDRVQHLSVPQKV